MIIDFSIIIPTKNRKDFLQDAIRSIINQKGVNYEIIIIDDNSTDDTYDMIKEYQKLNVNIKYYKNDVSLFAHGSRKKGYSFSKGKYIVFMDDDDYYIDNSFFKDVKQLFEKNENLASVIGSTILSSEGKLLEPLDLRISGYVENYKYINYFNTEYKKPMSSLTAIFKKEYLEQMNFSECQMINDTCIYLYGIALGDTYIINRPVAAYRIHSNNISKRKFNIDFIKNNLFEKKKIFYFYQKKKILCNPYQWYFDQIKPTIYYFISSSNKDFITVLYISFWIIFFGYGLRIRFIKSIIQKITNKKGDKK